MNSVRALNNIIIPCISVRNGLRVYPFVSIEKVMYMKQILLAYIF
jgi:hypothetical protein